MLVKLLGNYSLLKNKLLTVINASTRTWTFKLYLEVHDYDRLSRIVYLCVRKSSALFVFRVDFSSPAGNFSL